MPGPLHGIRVVEFTSVVLGPWACQLLADMGADVIKVEAPGGDIIRHIGDGRHPGMGPIFLAANHGKRSIVLDLKQAAARVCAADAARVAVAVGHQVHGAVGVTTAHELHHHTRRLLAWPQESGWTAGDATALGRAATGGAALWELVTGAAAGAGEV